MLLVVVIRGRFRVAVAFGPIFSSHAWSIVWEAMACPRARFSLGVRRWIIIGKKPSMLEKWWRESFGVGLYCLLVNEASSSAVRRPMIVTARAAVLRRRGMDITGVFRGVIFEVIRSPAMMLPQANRLIGLITVGLFSLMGERGLKRGCPMETKKITRRL